MQNVDNPLHIASRKGKAGCVELLLKSGANPSKANNSMVRTYCPLTTYVYSNSNMTSLNNTVNGARATALPSKEGVAGSYGK